MAVGILLACALLPFAGTRLYPHVHDDHDFRDPGSLVADARGGWNTLWQADVFGTYDQPYGQSGFWRPLLLLGFRAEFALTEGRPLPYAWLGHVLTILFHVLATLALWKLLLALKLPMTGALVVAAVFASHPVHAESVAWISGRTDILPVLLAWTGTCCLLESRSRPGLVLALLALTAAPLAKESGVLLVGMAAPLTWCAGRSWRRAVVIPVLALVAYGALRLASFEHGLAPDAYTGPESSMVRWWTWLSILPDFLRWSLWPGSAAVLHPVAPVPGLGEPRVWIGLLALAVCGIGAVRSLQRRQAIPFMAWGLMAGTFVLLAPWVRFPLGYTEVAAPLYERHLYAAAMAPALGLAWWGRRKLEQAPLAALLLALGLGLVYGTAAQARTSVWSSDEAFARSAVQSLPRSPELWNHLGWALMNQAFGPRSADHPQSSMEALAAFERAASLEPGNLHARLNRFILLARLGRDEQAELAADELLRRNPEDPAVLDNIASWHVGHRRWEAAVLLLEREMITGRPRPGAREALGLAREALDQALNHPLAPQGEPAEQH